MAEVVKELDERRRDGGGRPEVESRAEPPRRGALPSPLDRLDADAIPEEVRGLGSKGDVALLGTPDDLAIPSRLWRGNYIRCLAVSPDGGRLAGSGPHGRVTVWDARTGRPIGLLPGATREPVDGEWMSEPVVDAVAFSSDGTRLAAAGSCQTKPIVPFETELKETLSEPYAKRHAWLRVFELKGDAANPVATRDVDWQEEESGYLDLRGFGTTAPDGLSRNYWPCPASVAFSPDGRVLVWGGRGPYSRGWLQVLETEGGELRERATWDHFAGPVAKLAFSADGRHLMAGFGPRQFCGNTFRAWNADDLTKESWIRYATLGRFCHTAHMALALALLLFYIVWWGIGSLVFGRQGTEGSERLVTHTYLGMLVFERQGTERSKRFDNCMGLAVLVTCGLFPAVHAFYLAAASWPTPRPVAEVGVLRANGTGSVVGWGLVVLVGLSGALVLGVLRPRVRRLQARYLRIFLWAFLGLSGLLFLRSLWAVMKPGDTVGEARFAFSQDGTAFVAATPRGDFFGRHRGEPGSVLYHWRLSGGEWNHASRTELPFPVEDAALFPDGRTLATADLEAVRLWAVRPDEIVPEEKTIAMPATALALSPDGSRLAYGDTWGRAGAVRPDDPRPLVPKSEPKYHFYAIAVASDGRTLATVGHAFDADGKATRRLSLWDLARGRPLLRAEADLEDEPSPPPYVSYSPDGRWLLVEDGHTNRSASLWDARDGKLRSIARYECDRTPDARFPFAFCPDGKTLAVGHREGGLNLYALDRPGAPAVAALDAESSFRRLAYAPRGGILAAVPFSGGVRLWDTGGREAPRRLEGVPAPDAVEEWDIHFAPDGRLLTAAESKSAPPRLEIRRLDGGVPSAPLTVEGVLPLYGFSSAGEKLTCLVPDDSRPTRIQVGWIDLAADPPRYQAEPQARCTRYGGRFLIEPLSLMAPLLSPDGSTLVVPKGNYDLRLYDGARLSFLRAMPMRSPLRDMKFTPDSRHLVLLHADHTVSVVRLQAFDKRPEE